MQSLQTIKQRFGIVGNASQLNYAIQVAMQVAPTDMNILITGESGSGKESFSKIIHSLSKRKHNNFIAINCGAIPEGTINSELFGHEKGAFTGATESRKGYFEVTNGGTIFLDEVGEMPLETQARLLRVLESGEYLRVGSNKTLKTDVRVVAATNVNLIEAVEKRKFREDLYFRLNTVPINVPPLRERGDDMYLLFRKFAADFSEKYHVKPVSLDENAQRLLQAYRFPGNVRQLKNLVDRISVLEVEHRYLTADMLRRHLPKDADSRFPVLANFNSNADPIEQNSLIYKMLFDMKKDIHELKEIMVTLLHNQKNAAAPTFPALPNKHRHFDNQGEAEHHNSSFNVYANSDFDDKHHHDTLIFNDTNRIEDITPEEEEETLSLQKIEKDMIVKALRRHGNKRKYAAQDLGISERTLYRKIKQYNLEKLSF